jgi:hypothetical protein
MGGVGMTRARIYGEDNMWGKWLRSAGGANDWLPSSSDDRGYTVNDWDAIIHAYKMPVDKLGTREVQCLMFLECKTRMGLVSDSQRETLWINHRKTIGKSRMRVSVKRVGARAALSTVWHFGVSVLQCDGDSPATSSRFGWGRFQESGRIEYAEVSSEQVKALLRFDINPDDFAPMDYRRRHKTEEIEIVETSPLGFKVYSKKWRRS